MPCCGGIMKVGAPLAFMRPQLLKLRLSVRGAMPDPSICHGRASAPVSQRPEGCARCPAGPVSPAVAVGPMGPAGIRLDGAVALEEPATPG